MFETFREGVDGPSGVPPEDSAQFTLYCLCMAYPNCVIYVLYGHSAF